MTKSAPRPATAGTPHLYPLPASRGEDKQLQDTAVSWRDDGLAKRSNSLWRGIRLSTMPARRITKVLIANRGEIACRVIRACRELDLRTVAVHSDADAAALHVRLADEAVAIGPPPARESYLRAEKIVAAIKQTGADAVHPGYGFLSENADFAEAVAAAGLTWVGPPASAIRALGSKSSAKAIAKQLGVPCLPGYFGEVQSDERFE